jgi:hypothetical protein
VPDRPAEVLGHRMILPQQIDQLLVDVGALVICMAVQICLT